MGGSDKQIQTGSQFSRRKGDTSDIIDPLIGQAKNIIQVYDNAIKNIFWRKVLKMAENNTELAQRFTKDPVPPKSRWVPIQALPDGRYVGGYQENMADKQLSNDYIRIYRDGKPEYVFVSPEFGLMHEIIGNQQIDNYLALLRLPTILFTRLTTSMNIFFAAGNFTVDQFTALLQTKAGYKPVVDPVKLAGSYVINRITNASNEQIKQWNKYMSMGGDRQSLAGFFDTNLDSVDKFLKDKKKVPGRKYVEKGIDLLEMPSNMSEWASRVGEFIRAKEKGLTDVEALHMANQVTVPFSQMGAFNGSKFLKTFVKSIAFLNPMLQVNWKFYKTVKNDPKRLAALMAGVATTVGATLYAIANAMGDDEREEYIEFLANEPVSLLARRLYIPAFGGRGFVTLRIPEQLGGVTAIAYMMFVEHYRANDYKMSEYAEALTSWLPDQAMPLTPGLNITEGLSKFGMSWVPQGLKAGLMVATNTKVFPELAPIVPYYVSKKHPSLQYTEYTGDVAKMLGDVTNTSPMLIDAFVKAQFGAVGGMLFGRFPQNPIFAQMNDHLTRGRIWNDFYEQRTLLEGERSLINAGKKADIKDINNLYLKSKLYNKMADATRLIREEYKTTYNSLSLADKMLGSKDVFPPILRKELFGLLRDVSRADYYGKPVEQSAMDVAIKMGRMKVLVARAKRKLKLDTNFISSALSKDIPRADKVRNLEKLLKSTYIKDMVDQGMDRNEAIRSFERLME